MRLFKDRSDAGRQLAQRLNPYAQRANAKVLALPRGGVPVAYEIARSLKLPLDVLVVRKLGAPGQPELALGAIATGGAEVINPDVATHFKGFGNEIDATREREKAELARRERSYRGERAALDLKDAVAILVDDGAATGATMRVAVAACRKLGASKVVVALPVASQEAAELLRQDADQLIVLEIPAGFYAVGQWYREFDQTGDSQVRELLAAAEESPRRNP